MRSVFAILWICLAASATTGPVDSNRGYHIDHGDSAIINVHGIEKKVTNNHASGLTIYIPLNTATEWSTYIAKPPPGVLIEDAVDPCTGTPAIGTVCNGGPKYAGTFNYGGSIGTKKVMVTPGNCTNSATPTCNDQTDALTKRWGTAGTTHGTVSTTDGLANSEALASGWSDTDAAKYCINLVYGGYDDWYLPAIDELNMLYDNKGAIGSFANQVYWSSTERDTATAHSRHFSSGTTTVNKGGSMRIRCIRRY